MQLCSRAFLETPSNEKPHLKLAWLDGATDGLIALTGGPGGPLDAAIVAGQADLAGARCAIAAEAVRRPALHGVAAPRHAGRAGHRRRADRACLCQGHPARRHQRAVLRQARGLRRPRRADCHRRRARRRRDRPPPAHRRALFQKPRRDGRAVRRPAGGAGLDRRDRRALRVPAAHRKADPAALLGRRPRGRRGRRVADARRGGPGAPHRSRTGSRPAAPSRNTASGWPSSCR